MVVRSALCRSREDRPRPTARSVRHESIVSAHLALGSFGAGSSRSSREPSNLPFPITCPPGSRRRRIQGAGFDRTRVKRGRLWGGGRGRGRSVAAGKMGRSAPVFQALLVFLTIIETQWSSVSGMYCADMASTVYRPHSVTITEFGAVGDGVTLNTKAFQNAIFYLNSFADKGGAQLFVPAGRWLTGGFSLISHLTLSLDKDAVIIGSPCLNVALLVGANGTIDGQGAIWWDWFYNNTLNYTRPHLVELMYSTNVVISNLTFKNSPFWNIHPVYCSQVIVEHITILAPLNSPNTDGINPDSSTNVCISHCYVRNGDDVVVIKSGWDEYGISFAQPSSNISISNITGETGGGAGIAIGSEMSGGISEVRAEGIRIVNSLHGIRIKTAPGRGGYVRNVYIADVSMHNVSMAIRINGNYGEHPDNNYDKNALPIISNITIENVVGVDVGVAGILEGIEGDNFSSICISNVSLSVRSRHPWNCSLIQGYSNSVTPESCEQLRTDCEETSICYDGGSSLAVGSRASIHNKPSANILLNSLLQLVSL
uniref:Putative polygalacturonase n=1 Tax=Aegilops tauschii TaxID=37682 RepID=N1R460_AEGTA